MTEFEKIMEYQKWDLKLSQLKREFDKNEDKKRLDSVRAKFAEEQSKLDSGSVESDRLVEEIQTLYDEFNGLIAEFENISKSIDKGESEDKIAEDLASLERIKSKIDGIEHRISGKIKRCSQIASEGVVALENKKKYKVEYDKYKGRYDSYRDTKAPEKKEIEDKLAELLPALDKDILELYKAHKSDIKLPVFVWAVGESEKDYACYCGMSLSQTNKSELKNKGKCQCENCRRYVFLKK